MTDSLKYDFCKFVFHLHTDKHEVLLGDFIKISDSLDATCKALSNIFLDENKAIICIKPPKQGSIEIVYDIGIALGVNFAWDTLNGILTEFTGHDVCYYSGKIARAFTDCISSVYKTQSYKLKTMANKFSGEAQQNLDKLIKSQTDLYVAIDKIADVTGISFFDNKKGLQPDVVKKDFSFYTSRDIQRQQPPKQMLKQLIVCKSINVDDKGTWEFKDVVEGTTFKAPIEDDLFRQAFLNGKIPIKKTKQDDVVLALVEYEQISRNGVISSNNKIIKEIYKFNNKVLRKMPDSVDKSDVYSLKTDKRQMELFQ